MKSTKQNLLAIAAAMSALGLAPFAVPSHAQAAAAAEGKAPIERAAAEDPSIRPFTASIPEAAIVDLRQRIAATRWPERETVNDRSQGVQLEPFQELVRHWGTNYDWRKAEARLNAYPQFVTKIDGLDIHFIHVKSRHPNAMPLPQAHLLP